MILTQNVGHGSDVGMVRPLNEDYHRVWQFPTINGNLTLLAVADGMGGAAAGEIASKLAIEILDKSFKLYVAEINQSKPVVGIDRLIEKSIRFANRQIFKKAFQEGEHRGMGTTLTLIAAYKGEVHLGHVGDSRAYLLRDDSIYQLTKDHSWVAEQIDKGLLTEEAAETHEWRNLITRALGTRIEVTPDVIEITLKNRDVFVLATDGLHGLVKPVEILEEIRQNKDHQAAVEYLISMANERGGHDNITMIVSEINS